MNDFLKALKNMFMGNEGPPAWRPNPQTFRRECTLCPDCNLPVPVCYSLCFVCLCEEQRLELERGVTADLKVLVDQLQKRVDVLTKRPDTRGMF